MVKSLLITDLDNTLFDWVGIWHKSFSAMISVVQRQTGIDRDKLKAEIRAVHQSHGTSEYAFLLEELPTVRMHCKGRPVTEVFAEAINAYRRARAKALVLYPTVLETLTRLKNLDCRIIAYTDSPGYYSGYRIRQLGLDGLISHLYSPMNHELPDQLSKDEIDKHTLDHREFEITTHRQTPKGEVKPNPHILCEIIRSTGARVEDCVYVGDSLHKDIAMAKDAGVDHAWARYGVAHTRDEYQLLKDVTHWTQQDVQRERGLSSRDVVPDVSLEHHFSEILDWYQF